MNKTVIHIGYPKAASTWLKINFFSRSDQYQFVHEVDVVDQIIKPNALSFKPDQHKDFFEKEYGDNLVISESMLSGSLVMTGNNSVYTKEISNRLKLVFPDAQIIIFIRNQLDMISSAYLEYIRKGGSFKVNRYLWRIINIPLEFRLEFFEFDLMINQYIRLFGEKNVHVYCYEQFVEDPTKIAIDLNQKFAFNIPLKQVDFELRNAAFQKNLYPFVRFFNQFTRKGVFLKRYFIDLPYPRKSSLNFYNSLNNLKIFGGKADPGKVLGSNNLIKLQNYFRRSNQNLGKILKSVDLRELGYPL